LGDERIAIARGIPVGDRKARLKAVTRPLRIGVDARELLGASTGVGRYLGELMSRWTTRSDAERRRFVLFSPEPLMLAFPSETTDVRIIGSGRGTAWEQIHLRRAIRRESLDVFFAPAYTAPLGTRAPVAVTIHDVSFVAHPEWFRVREGFRRRWLTLHAARMAASVLTVSEFSKNEIAHHLRVNPSRIHVIANGITSRFSAGRVRQGRQPLVLFVGSIFNRRRVPDLIAAFAQATTDLPQARLAIVGHDRSWPPQNLTKVAAAHGVAGRTEILSYISDAVLADFYARASVFAFLSEYEGFGLTPLEALSAGVPPIVLDTAVAREVYGEAAIYVQPGDIDGAAEAVRRCLVDPQSANAVLAHAPAVLARYSWDDAARRTLEQLELIARPR
jgi:glycosyltransferase involved in cell wall biosynthesis